MRLYFERENFSAHCIVMRSQPVCCTIGAKRSGMVAIVRKPLFSERNNHCNHMETSLYGNCSAIKVATKTGETFRPGDSARRVSRNDRSTFLVAIVAKPALKEWH